MEYTKDIIFSVEHVKRTSFIHKILKRLIQIIQKDNYFTLTIIISLLCLTLDFVIVKRFIEIVNLL